MKSQLYLPKVFLLPPIVLMIVVFVVQLFLSNFSVLSRWKGGGFGMFSDISDIFFHIHIHKSYTNLVDCAEFPGSYSMNQRKMRYFPSYGRIDDLLKKMSQNKWAYYSKFSRKSSSTQGIRMINRWEKNPDVIKYLEPSYIEIEVWQTTFDARTLRAIPIKIRNKKRKYEAPS